jgi:hypothetical protein
MSLQSGSTVPGTTPRKQYGKSGIYVDVDTSGAGFRVTPPYFTSLGGNSNHWSTSGSNAVYNATPNGFRIYLRWPVVRSLGAGLLNPPAPADRVDRRFPRHFWRPTVGESAVSGGPHNAAGYPRTAGIDRHTAESRQETRSRAQAAHHVRQRCSFFAIARRLRPRSARRTRRRLPS